MYFSRSIVVAALAGFAAAQSAVSSARGSLSTGVAGSMAPAGMVNTHIVQVGGPNGSLIFSPNNVKAKAGDLIQFQFHAKVGPHHSKSEFAVTDNDDRTTPSLNLPSTSPVSPFRT